MNGGDENHFRQFELLEFHQSSIILDLEVQDVIPELLENLVLVHDDKQRIEHEKTYEDRATMLLSIIKRKAEDGQKDALPVFVNSLRDKYTWLYSKLTQDELDFKVPKRILPKQANHENNQQKIKRILEAGGVQCLPRYSIDRADQVENIRMELKILKPHNFLVLTGMAGCGKSVLATQALQSAALATNIFKDGIFWLPIGKECSEAKDAILAKMRILCDKLGELRAPNSLENGAELLRTAFQKRADSLLILDDVWRPEVVKAFDVGCRTLVTTRDLSVLDVVSGRVKGMRIADGFTERESLQLFCQSLGTTLEELPEEAKSIHAESKGSPMVISLISALFHDHDIKDSGRWNHYLTSLRKRKYSQMRRIRDYEHESVLDAISLSVESLDPKDRGYYFDFALFLDDVGIPCPVLMVLWGMGKYDVEDIMNRLVRKSLAVDEYDPQRKCKIYSVHDLQLDYLKYQILCDDLTSEEALHQKFINQYLQYCEHKLEKLADDGYIHFHLGYHLYKAQMTDYFRKAYLNLLFLGEKMRITGTADLLVDLRKYKEFIISYKNREENSKLIEEITTFAQSVGHRLYNQPDVDIVQIALEMPHLTRMYKQAKEMARGEHNRLYIEWSNASSNQWKNPEAVVFCTDNVRCVKFVGNRGNYFLAALTNGCIELCDLESCRICHLYTGHTSKVQAIDVFESHTLDKLIFVSASEDKTCKLWNLKTTLESLESTKTEQSSDSSPSPKVRCDVWSFDKPQDESCLTFEFHTATVLHAEFSRDGTQVISTSLNEILIWTSHNGQILTKISVDLPSSPNVAYQACHFSRQEEFSRLPFLLMSCENQVVLYSLESPSIFSAIEGHHMKIVALMQFPNDSFCTVSENEIGIWKIMHGKTPPKSRSLSPRKSFPITTFPEHNQNFRKTQVDALPIEPQLQEASGSKIYKTGELLRPTNLNSRNSSQSSGGDSPTFISDCYSPTVVHTFIDTGKDFVQIGREELLPKKTRGLFQCAAATNTGELLACGTSDRKIMLWQLEKRFFLGEFNCHNGPLRCLDFSKVDRWTLLSGDQNNHTVMVWDLEEEQKGRKEPRKNLLYSSVFIDSYSSPGYFVSLFTTNANTVQVYQDHKQVLETVPLKFAFITAVALRKDAKFAIFGTNDGKLYKMTLDLLTATKKYSEKEFTEIGSCIDYAKILHLAFDEDSSLLVAGTDAGNVLVFQDLKFLRSIKCECKAIVNFHFPFDMLLMIVCREDVIIKVENFRSSQLLKGWKIDEDVRVICSASTTTDTAIVALGTARDGIFLYDLDAEIGITPSAHITSQHNPTVRSLKFSDDKSRLAVGNDGGLIKIWKCNNKLYEEELDLIFHKSSVRSFAFSPDGKWLVSCGDKLAFWTFEKPIDHISKPSFMEERRRKKSGDESSRPNSRFSLEIGEGIKIGRKGKRELLQSFFFYGAYAQKFVSDPYFKKFATVDDGGIFYLLEILSNSIV